MREPEHDEQDLAPAEVVDQVEPDQVAAEPSPDEPAPPAPTGRRPRPSRRRQRPRSRTIARKALTREELRAGWLMFPPVEDDARPRTRGACVDGERPCPWVACAHHLYLDVDPETGSIKFNFPDLEPDELAATCALDLAERGGITLEEVGAIMNLTRERIRQVEVRGLLKLRMASPSPDEIGAALLHRHGALMRTRAHRFDFRLPKKGRR